MTAPFPADGPTVLAVVGSRECCTPGWEERARLFIAMSVDRLGPERLVSGGARGVDALAAAYAHRHRLDLVEHLAVRRQWEGPDGYRARNARIARECTHLLCIRCAHSPTYGSGWTADLAESLGKVVTRVPLC